MSSELVKRLGNALDALMIAPAGERAQREAKVRELVSRLSLALTEARAKLVEAEPMCGCEWDESGQLDAVCMTHWQYFWKLHGPHCTAKPMKNLTAGSDPAIYNIADAALSSARREKP